MNIFRYIVIPCALLLCIWFGWITYSYFFDTTTPTVVMNGINENICYSGDLDYTIFSNKNGEVTMLLDGQSIVTSTKIKARYNGGQFVIPTKTLSNGKHTIKMEFADNTFHKNRVTLERNFYVDNTPLQAAFINEGAAYTVSQGRTLHIKLQTNKEIKTIRIAALARDFMCHRESKGNTIYECFIPIECEQQAHEYPLSAYVEDKVGNTIQLDNKFQVIAYPFKKEIITISQAKVQEEKSLGKHEKDLESDLAQLLERSPQEKLWRGPFCTPIEIQRISCEFGTIRTTQHKGRYAHKAVDVINDPKSVVWASQDGIIVLKDRFAPSGNTVVIDHGLGIMSLFYHLDDFADSLHVGQKIAQGNPIGTIGKTGFATGYHLHWEMRINNIAVDPLQWTKVSF